MPTLVSLREFSRMQGWNPGYTHKLKEAGRLVTAFDERDRECIDVEASIERLAQTADPSRGHMVAVNEAQRARHRGGEAPAPTPPPASGNATFNQARAAREVFEAKTAEVEYRRLIGELVSATEVERQVGQRVALMREQHLAIAARLAPLFAQETDARKIRTLLDAELRKALAHVAQAQEAPPA